MAFQANLVRLESNGRAAFEAMESVVKDWTVVDAITPPVLGYTFSLGANPLPLDGLALAKTEADGQSIHRWIEQEVSPATWSTGAVPHGTPIYIWLVNPDGGIFIVFTDKRGDGNPSNLSIYYGELLWINWRNLAAADVQHDVDKIPEALAKLRTIWRFSISSPPTMTLINHYRRSTPNLGEWSELTPTDAMFFVFLASAHGKFLPLFLQRHTNDLGRLTIEKLRIQLTSGDKANFCWVLKPAVMPSEKPTRLPEFIPTKTSKYSPAKMKRMARRNGTSNQDVSPLLLPT
ncbi:hypothetical protein EG327_009032 [Venturia inaequalis]|uniref:Uncharacterized protein n=1 Tax=Venturia inaequalis TaxID=5025 RepID=A0A8H3URR6_VENIN|nr:hypothetical protein EG327_009032 [Venturia inaequalis]